MRKIPNDKLEFVCRELEPSAVFRAPIEPDGEATFYLLYGCDSDGKNGYVLNRVLDYDVELNDNLVVIVNGGGVKRGYVVPVGMKSNSLAEYLIRVGGVVDCFVGDNKFTETIFEALSHVCHSNHL